MSSSEFRKLLTFIQPRSAAKYPFMSLYDAGYVAVWLSDCEEFERKPRSLCDIVVCDYDSDPDCSNRICESLKSRNGSTRVVFTSKRRLSLPEHALPHAVLPVGLDLRDFLHYLDDLTRSEYKACG